MSEDQLMYLYWGGASPSKFVHSHARPGQSFGAVGREINAFFSTCTAVPYTMSLYLQRIPQISQTLRK